MRRWLFGVMVFASTFSAPTVYAQTTVNVELRDTGVIPAAISAVKDKPVNIHVVNKGSKPHNLVIPDFYIFTQTLNPGDDVDVSFTPDKTGGFDYYSDTGGKPEPGIRGKLVIAP